MERKDRLILPSQAPSLDEALAPELDREALSRPVAVLYNAYDELIKGEPQDLIADQGVELCARAVVESLEQLGLEVVPLPFKETVEQVLYAFPPQEYTIFNFAEGMSGRLFEEARIAWTLESMGYAFTGSDGHAIALSTNKARAKKMFQDAGLATPDWWVIRHPDELVSLDQDDFPFPLIVKPVAEDGSIGLSSASVVKDMRGLKERLAFVVEHYRQSALVERFIDGREINVALWGIDPHVLAVAEIDFVGYEDPLSRIVSFDAKWQDSSYAFHNTPARIPADLTPRQSHAIHTAARHAWRLLGCMGYARVDIRLDREDVPYIIEVNCNPDISPGAGFAHAAQAVGYTYTGMVRKILMFSRRRTDVYRTGSAAQRWPLDHDDYRTG